MRAVGQGESGAGGPDPGDSNRLPVGNERLACNRCGFPVSSRALGCKNPCANCGTVYPLGDCSD